MPAPGHGVLLQTGTEGRGQLSGTSFLGLGGVSGNGRHVVVGLGAVGLNLLGAALFSFLHSIVLPNVGVGIWQWRSELAHGYWTHLPFHFQKGFHLFNHSRVGAESCVPRCTLDHLGCPVWPKYVCPLHGCDLYFHIDHLYQEFASEETMQEVSLWLK